MSTRSFALSPAAWRRILRRGGRGRCRCCRACAGAVQPKAVVQALADDVLRHYQGQPLVDAYAVYQHLMDYWAATMHDDVDRIAAEGWQALPRRVIEVKKGKDGKPGKQIDRGWVCDLVPKELIVARFFAEDRARLDALQAALERAEAQQAELEEEHGGEDAIFSGYDKINAVSVKERMAEIRRDADAVEERRVLEAWLKLAEAQKRLKSQIKDEELALDGRAFKQYPLLSEAQVQALVVEHKWLAALESAVHGEMDRISSSSRSG